MSSPFSKNHFLTITPDGEMHGIKLSTFPIKNADKVIKEMSSKFQNVDALLLVSDCFFEGRDTFVHYCTSAKTKIAAIYMPEIKIATWFKKSADHCIIPCFQKEENAYQAVYNWVPPKRCKPYFFYIEEDGHFLCYTAFVDAKDWSIHSNILPNVHSDGKVCMGDTYNPKSYHDIVSKLIYSFEHFRDSSWNSDLSDSVSRKKIESAIKFNQDGSTIETKGLEWRGNKLSHFNLNWIVDAAKAEMKILEDHGL